MWPVFGRCVNLQISRELKQYHDVEALEDVRVIRDRQTSKSTLLCCHSAMLTVHSQRRPAVLVF